MHQDDYLLEDDSYDNMELLEVSTPEGERYTLNSKRLKAHHVQQIAEALGIHQEILVAEKRQVITSRLKELGYEAPNVQVIIQGRGDDTSMFLVNTSGVIKTIDCAKIISYHADQGTGPIELRSALRSARRENEELQTKLEDSSHELNRVSSELMSANDTIAGEKVKVAEI